MKSNKDIIIAAIIVTAAYTLITLWGLSSYIRMRDMMAEEQALVAEMNEAISEWTVELDRLAAAGMFVPDSSGELRAKDAEVQKAYDDGVKAAIAVRRQDGAIREGASHHDSAMFTEAFTVARQQLAEFKSCIAVLKRK